MKNEATNVSSERVAKQPRIAQIVDLASQGLTDKEIAVELAISRHTVDEYWRRLREKLGVDNRTAAVAAHLRETIERQTQELREAKEALRQSREAGHGGMAALLSATHKRLTECQAHGQSLSEQLDYFLRATHVAHAGVYEFDSINPVKHRFVDTRAFTLEYSLGTTARTNFPFYDVAHSEDRPLIDEKLLGATYAPDERYIFLYRLLMPEPRWVLDINQAVYNGDDTQSGIRGVVIDVHDLVLAGVLYPIVTRIVVATEAIPLDSHPH